MWDRGRQKHCSNEVLLAHADGELPPRTEQGVSAHLHSCWECRSRLAEIELQVHDLARLAASPDFPGPERLAAAKGRFAARRREYERELAAGPARRLFRIPPLFWSAAVAASAGIAIFFWTLRTPSPPAPEARFALEQARLAEQKLATASPAIHQVFQVELAQTRPAAQPRSGQLEIWSDRAHNRYASRWTDRAGRLQYAAWQPSAAQRYQRDSDVSGRIVPAVEGKADLASVLDLSAYDLDGVQAAFLTWLRGRAWQPVALSSDFAAFASREGVLLRTERLRRGDVSVVRVTAQRSDRRVRIEFALDLEDGSYRPRIQTIRFETAGRSLELRLAALKEEGLSSDTLSAAVFEPPLSRPEPHSVLSPGLAPPPAPRPAAPAADQEIEIWYALHRAHACLTEAVSVERKPKGLAVRGMVASAERREHLLAVLASHAVPDLDVEIEVGAPKPPKQHRAETGTLPGEAIRRADDGYLEALALVRLAERFRDTRIGDLSSQSRWLLESMLRDHLRALDAGSRGVRELLEPLLPAGGASVDQGAGPAPADWSAACFALFATVDRMDELMQELQGSPSGSRPAAALELRGLFNRLSERLEDLETVTSRQLAGEAQSTIMR